MPGLLISHAFHHKHNERLAALESELGFDVDHIVMPEDPDGRVGSDDLRQATLAFFSSDIYPSHSRQFFAAAQGAENLEWMHIFPAGSDFPLFQDFLKRGIRLTNSSGASAVPIAQTAIAGLLMLARGFPHWLDAQRRRSWEPLADAGVPGDLSTQTMLVVGVGAIGREISRLGQALGLYVIGVRRSPRDADDPVDEMHTPSELPGLYPRADWLAIAAPLTAETEGLIDSAALDALPAGTALLNVGRGPIVDEAAMTERLATGALSGAYLDVFEEEPLSESSKLWELPNVIISPHNSAASTGNAGRVTEIFFDNYQRWASGNALLNEVSPA